MLLWLSNLGNAGGSSGTGADTAAKRRSVLQFDAGWFVTGPLPDGSIDQADRQHVGMKYTGILAGAPPVPPAQTDVLLNMLGRGLSWGLASGLG